MTQPPLNMIHQDQPIFMRGELDTARAVMVMLHGRGASAQSILALADNLPTDGYAFIAPQAFEHTWYPYSFLQPIATNEPYLSSALATVDNVVERVTDRGFALEQVILLGFSQGACLALEYAARHARRYGGVIGLSGGLIGPDGTSRNYGGSLAGTPVFLGCSTVDFHIPKQRVLHSAEVLRRLDGEVTDRLYPNMGHTINDDEIAFITDLMTAVLAS